jgi:hypothetical protein
MAKSHVQDGSIIGLNVQGDLGPITFYTQFKAGKRTIVGFAKIWLSDPTTLKQLNHRNRVRNAATTWNALGDHEKKNWQTACSRLSLRLNGYALWTYYQMTADRRSIVTIERQAGITLITGIH